LLARPDFIRRWRIALFFGFLFFSLAGAAGRAQDAPPSAEPELRREFDELFQRILREPTNLDVAFRYAEVAAKLGDYEAAITALERMLFFNPDLPRVQLELGVLYFRLGSYEVARSYLQRARATPDAPPEVRERIDLYLGELARLESRHQYSATIFTGVQRQSNANVSPASPLVRVGGIDATLADQFTKKADTSFFLSGAGIYSYDLQTQDRDTIEVTGNAFLSEFIHQKRFDLDFVEVTAGPRLRVASSGLPATSLRPYAIGDFVVLDHSLFFTTLGAGIEATHDVTKNFGLSLAYEHREKRYHSAQAFPTGPELTAADEVGALRGIYAFARNQVLDLTLSIVDENARTKPNSNFQYGAVLGYQIAYAAPFGNPALLWQTSAAVGRFYIDYSAPDPFFDPDITRFDRRWRMAITQAIPVTENIAAIIQLERDVVSSTLPNFAYTNNQVVVGPQFRF
jgi:tetratricopeptide (TPR) repeat protein